MTTRTTTQQSETCPLCDRDVSTTKPEHEQYLQLETWDETGLVSMHAIHQLCGSCWVHLKDLCTQRHSQRSN